MILLPQLIAHRCGGRFAPENTLAGLHAAARAGCRGVEFDVMLSADGTPVLIHDETLERTTNGSGRVCDTPDAVLFSLDAGQGENVPSLEKAAMLCERYGFFTNIEIKPATGHESVAGDVVARFVAEHWDGSPPLLSSFSLTALQAAKWVAPQLNYGLLYESVPSDWLNQHKHLGAATLHCAAENLTDGLLAEAQAAGVPVLCYTVNDALEARSLLKRGVSSIFSDELVRACL